MSPVPPSRRGACPAFLAPMETGDGLVLRLFPADGALTFAQLSGIAQAARVLGNGMMEVTARGSLQVRGLRAETVEPLRERIIALGVTPRLGRAIDLSPLSGLDPTEIADARPLARRIRDGISGLEERLGPKVSVVIDGGGAISLDGRKADVRLKARRGQGDAVWTVAVGGGPAVFGSGAEAAEHAVHALTRLAALGRRARSTDLPGCGDTTDAIDTPPAPPLGRIPLADTTFAFGIGLPFGAGEAALFAALATAAEAAGARDLRPAPERTLLATGLHATGVEAFAAAAEQLGCIVAPKDPRAFVAACPGAPACASAHFPARELAPQVASVLAPLLDGTVSVHLSACTKGCAHPAPTTLAFVGMDCGVALVHEGAPSKATGPARPVEQLVEELRALAATPRAAGETGRDLIRRIDAARLWARRDQMQSTIGT